MSKRALKPKGISPDHALYSVLVIMFKRALKHLPVDDEGEAGHGPGHPNLPERTELAEGLLQIALRGSRVQVGHVEAVALLFLVGVVRAAAIAIARSGSRAGARTGSRARGAGAAVAVARPRAGPRSRS